MDRDLVRTLRARGLWVTTALEEEMIGRSDRDHLEHATAQGCALLSFNRGDFYRLHTHHLSRGMSHAGLILANQQQHSVGEQARRILRLAAARSAEDMRNWVEFLSAWDA